MWLLYDCNNPLQLRSQFLFSLFFSHSSSFPLYYFSIFFPKCSCNNSWYFSTFFLIPLLSPPNCQSTFLILITKILLRSKLHHWKLALSSTFSKCDNVTDNAKKWCYTETFCKHLKTIPECFRIIFKWFSTFLGSIG